MFRIGGSAGTGITSGLDKPRTNYQFGGGADARRFMGNRMMQTALPMNTNQSIAAAAPTLSTRERLTQALGPGRNRNMGQFLTQFGLNLLSQTPTGNIFQTAAMAAQEPTKGLFDDLNREQDLKRQIALEAERLDIGQEQAIALQLLKNDEVAALPYQRKIQYLMDKLGLNEADAIRFVETSKTDYTKSTEEDKIQAAMNRMGVPNRSLAEYEVKFEPNIPTELRGGSNKLDQRKQKFPKNPQTDDIYYDKSKGKLYQYNGGDANDINSYTDVTEQYS